MEGDKARGKVPVTKPTDAVEENDSSWVDVAEETLKAPKTLQAAPKTPKNLLNKAQTLAMLKKQKLRAISTPNKNETILTSNVTFMNQSEADLSAIPVLSPPTVRKGRSKAAEAAKIVNEASFQ